MFRFPDVILAHIADYSVRTVEFYLMNEIRKVGNDLLSLQLAIGYAAEPELCRWRTIYALFEKYYWYQPDYESNIAYRMRRGISVNEHPPLLIDACFSGCGLPCAYSSKRQFDESVFADIREIIEFVPCALKSTFGQMRCRTRVTPLHAAIFNEAAPIELIAYLLEHGANPADKIYINGEPHHVCEDLYGNIHVKRIEAVLNLFKATTL